MLLALLLTPLLGPLQGPVAAPRASARPHHEQEIRARLPRLRSWSAFLAAPFSTATLAGALAVQARPLPFPGPGGGKEVLAENRGIGNVWRSYISADSQWVLAVDTTGGFQLLRIADGLEKTLPPKTAYTLSTRDGTALGWDASEIVAVDIATLATTQLLASPPTTRWSNDPDANDNLLGFRNPDKQLFIFRRATRDTLQLDWTVPGRIHRLLMDEARTHSAFLNLDKNDGGNAFLIVWDDTGHATVTEVIQFSHPYLYDGDLYGYQGQVLQVLRNGVVSTVFDFSGESWTNGAHVHVGPAGILASNSGDRIVLVDEAQHTQTLVAHHGGSWSGMFGIPYPRMSPDGKWVVFQTDEGAPPVTSYKVRLKP